MSSRQLAEAGKAKPQAGQPRKRLLEANTFASILEDLDYILDGRRESDMNGAGRRGWVGRDWEGEWAERTVNGSGLADVTGAPTFRPLSSTVRQPVETF